MVTEIDKEGVFIPVFNGNQKLPSADQITVRYKIPTMAIKSRCRKKPQAKGISGANGRMEHIEIVIDRDDDNTLKEMLISISGCSYSCDGKEHHINNAQDIFNAPIFYEPLYKEIIAEFDKVLDSADINEEFYAAHDVFCISENLGCLPFSGGWAEQPAWIVRALSILKTEQWKADEQERLMKQEEAEDARKYGKRQ